MKATAGQADSLGHLAPVCSPDWHGCQSDAGPRGVEGHCISWQVQSFQFMPFPLPSKSSTLHIEKSHPGCNVNSAEGRSRCWANLGCPGEALALYLGSMKEQSSRLSTLQSKDRPSDCLGKLRKILGEGWQGQGNPSYCLPSRRGIVRWANPRSQWEGRRGTRQPLLPTSSWEAAPGSWLVAMAAQPGPSAAGRAYTQLLAAALVSPPKSIKASRLA